MRAFYVTLSHLLDASIHSETVVSGGDDQVHPFDEAVFIDLVVMYEGSARRFGNPDAFELVWFRKRAHMFVKNVSLKEDLLDALDSVKYFNQPRVMLQQGVVLERRMRSDESHKHAREISERTDLVSEIFEDIFEPGEGTNDYRARFRNHFENFQPLLFRERLANASRDRPRRMDAFSAKHGDDFLTEFPQRNSIFGDCRMRFDDAKDVTFGRIAVHPEEKIRRRQMEKAEGVRLDELRKIHEAPQLCCGRRDFHGEQRVACFCRGHQMAYRTNPAGAGS